MLIYTNCHSNTSLAMGTSKCIHLRSKSFLRFLLFISVLVSGEAFSQAFNLDQMANGKVTPPFPVVQPATSQWTWQNGNLNRNNAHFRESFSVPYRCDLTGLTAGTVYVLRIGIDVRVGGKFALDYFTGVQNLKPHGMFGHDPEKADPTVGLNFSPAPTVNDYPLPEPNYTGTTVATTSFNALPAVADLAGQPKPREIRIYNGTVANAAADITYENLGSVDINATTTEAILRVRFTATSNHALIAWGGHIAAEFDWPGQSAQFISGSPYHCHIRNLLDDNGNELAKGSTDRSLKTDAIFRPATCAATAAQTVCEGASSPLAYSFTGDPTGITNYKWELSANTAGVTIQGDNAAGDADNAVGTVSGSGFGTINIIPASGSTFNTPGSFSLALTLTNAGGTSEPCTSGGTIKAKPTLSLYIVQPTLCGNSPYGSLQVCSPKVGYTYDLFLSGAGTPTTTKTPVAGDPVIFGNIGAGTDPQIKVTSSATDGSCSNTFNCNTAGSTACVTPNAARAKATTKTDATAIAPEKEKPSVLAAPNPFNDRIRFTLKSAITGQGSLELYNMLGQKVKTVYSGFVTADQAQTIEYAVPLTQRANLIYIFRVGGQQITGKLIGLNNR